MAFNTQSHRFIFCLDIVRNEHIFMGFGMALDAANIQEVQGLVWQPIMRFQDIGIGHGRHQLVLIQVRMATQANIIVVTNGLQDVFIRPGIDLIGVGIVTHPAGKIITVFC